MQFFFLRLGASASGSDPDGSPAAFNTDELLPRSDISGQVTDALVANMGSSNWKERKTAMDDVDQILVAAGNRIEPQVGVGGG